jgi:hypothetical protein
LESCSQKNVLLFFGFFAIFNLSSAFLPSFRKKILDKEPFTDKMFAEYYLPSITLGKVLPDVK